MKWTSQPTGRWGVVTALVIVATLASDASVAATSTWHHVPPRDHPEARGIGAMVWDEARGEAVYFGGAGLNWLHDETWTWDGAQWTRRTPARSPGPRRYFDMAYDPVRREVVLFGGEGPGNAFLSDTWVWDGSDWTQRTPATSPPRRYRHAMAWDAAGGGVLLYGGTAPATPSLTGYAASDETWRWDGSTWTKLLAPATPGPRSDHAMVYDAARDEVILFGGTASYASIAGPTVNGMWAWNGSTWLLRHPDACASPVAVSGMEPPPCNAPSARVTFDLAYDAARGRVVLFGGGGGFHKDDTWTWDGLVWRKESPAARPRPRMGGAMAYDPVRQRVVMFGGHGTFGYMDDTWTWDGATWAQIVRSPTPLNRWDPAMAYDPVRGEVVMFGGLVNETGGRLDDTWTWDGVRWTRRDTPVRPPWRENAAVGFHPATGRIVLFGGTGYADATKTTIAILRDTWTWDGASWRQESPATVPAQRTSSRMATHEPSGRLVMFGGWAGSQRLDDFWEWDGANWIQLIPFGGSTGGLSPSPRNGHAMAYDPVRAVVLVHDGVGAPSDTWAWNGAAWAKYAPPLPLPDRDEATIAYGSGNDMVLFGGLESVTPKSNTFLWNGSAWSEHFPSRGPARRREHRMVWDAARGRGLMFGGADGLSLFNDTWSWGPASPAGANARPVASIAAQAVAGASVTYALGATDADGTIASWRLDVDYDGVADYSAAGTPLSTLTHEYPGGGTHTARLEVTDEFGDSRAATVTVHL